MTEWHVEQKGILTVLVLSRLSAKQYGDVSPRALLVNENIIPQQ